MTPNDNTQIDGSGLRAPASDAASGASPAPNARSRPRRGLLATAVYALLAVAVLAGGAFAAVTLIKTGPKAKRRPPERHAQLVEVTVARASRERAVVHAMGSVAAARMVNLQPRVPGEIVELDPECVLGGRFAAGQTVAKLDPADYEIAVEQQATEVDRLAAVLTQRQSEVLQRASDVDQSASLIEQRAADLAMKESALVQAEAALKIEQGQQAVAKREYELLGRAADGADRDLVLRRPQLQTAEAACGSARAATRSAEAALAAARAGKKAAEAIKQSAEAAVKAADAAHKAAEAALWKAVLDLERTTIRAPFNAIVVAESIDRGAQVSPTTTLARLVGTDEYWVEVFVPVDQLKWIQVPRTPGEPGSRVRVFNEAAWGPKVFRNGTVLRLDGSLEEQGRMARLLATVPDPLGLAEASGRPPVLLLGSYVRVEIDGAELDGVVPIPRALMRDGDHVWVMDGESKLDIRPVTVAFRSRDRVLVSGGLKAGERVVTSDLPAPVQGMALRTGAAPPTPADTTARGPAAEAPQP